jgi:broad specificity phosphatase PhoE
MNARLSLFALALVLTLAVPQGLAAQQTTTVVIVRHAEKTDEPASDPVLNAEGEARAQALLAALGDASIDAIYTTQFARNTMTAAPLAAATGIEPTVVRAGGGADYYGELVRRIRTEHPGGVVVVVGHSNTLGRTIAELGGPDDIGDLEDSEYDHFYVLLLTAGREPRLVRAKY